MKRYRIDLVNQVNKELRKIQKNVRNRILDAIRDLAANPRPDGVKKLKGESFYRIRVGNYRIVYTIEDRKLYILVLSVGHRSDVYERMKGR